MFILWLGITLGSPGSASKIGAQARPCVRAREVGWVYEIGLLYWLGSLPIFKTIRDFRAYALVIHAQINEYMLDIMSD